MKKKKNIKLPVFIDLIRWIFVDIYRSFKNGKKVHLYGIWLICGLYGQGKTMGLTDYLERCREKYGDKIYICTNYFYKGQDFPLEHWEQLLKDYDKPIIFGYDEIQNEFNSRDYKNFPFELVSLLTQNRKGNGKQIVGTAQRFVRVDKIFRELSSEIWECKTRFGRLTSMKCFDWEDYEMLLKTSDVRMRMKIKPKKRRVFVQSDYIRNQYDSYKMLDSAKTKEYISANEQRSNFSANQLVFGVGDKS